VLTNLDIGNITDHQSPMDVIRQLLNLIESLNRENQELKRQLQQLRDEINRLKGEQGKPTIRPKKGSPKNCSSEKERKEPKEGNKGIKKTASKSTRPDTAI
jgi:predicted  nucleic acid-binding Zn-ribbon protein